MSKPTILLTVDLEDWFQVENFKRYIDFSEWDDKDWRFERNTHKLLDNFDENGVSATFFILGWIAEKAPRLIREIQARGHEIASHGYRHDLCTSIEKSSLLNDLKCSKDILEEITGENVWGYRAPSFSISDELIQLLKEAGYRYDSSLDSSTLNSRHGSIDLFAYRRSGMSYQDKDGFLELPVSNLNLGNSVIPWGGGGYFRLLPAFIFNLGVKNIVKKNNGYVFYTHPWEFDPDQPRVTRASFLNRFRHYVNVQNNAKKLNNFIGSFKGAEYKTCHDYLFNMSSG